MDGDSGLAAAAEEETDRTNDPVFKVFYLDLLLDNILEKAIEGRTFTTMYNCRLVSKSFLASISRIVKKGYPNIMTLDLCNVDPVTQDNVVGEEDEGNDKIKLLESMIDLFSSPDRLSSISVLPLTLYFDFNANFFQSERNQSIISNFLTSEACSTNLTELIIWFSDTMDTFLNGIHEKIMLSFPNLATFQVRGFGKGGMDLDKKKLTFAQNVLSGTDKLEDFVFHAPPLENLPLQLPRTLETLDLRTRLPSAQLQEILLGRNPLSKLKWLTVCIRKNFDEKDIKIVEKILGKFQETLTAFFINGNNEMETPQITLSSPWKFRIPKMKQLDLLAIYGLPWSWASAKKGTSLVECFPVLKAIQLENVNDKTWSRFLGGGHFQSVIKLSTSIRRLVVDDDGVDDESDDDDDNVEQGNYDNDNLTTLQVCRLCEVFSNLQSLEAPIDQDGFPVLFREMRKLKTLIVHVELNGLTRDAQKWKLVLLGITVEEERRVQEIPRKMRFWNGPRAVQLRREDGAVSILDMSELVHFKLSIDSTPDLLGYALLTPWIFFLGFMQMANLKKLEFHGGFKPTQEMIQKWTRKHGGSISYTDEYGEDDYYDEDDEEDDYYDEDDEEDDEEDDDD